jgi:hypothetical protein
MRPSTSNAVLFLIAFVLGVILAAGWFYFVWEVLGEQECDRGNCSWIGDLSYGSSANIPLAVCMLIAGALVWSARALLHRFWHRVKD